MDISIVKIVISSQLDTFYFVRFESIILTAHKHFLNFYETKRTFNLIYQ